MACMPIEYTESSLSRRSWLKAMWRGLRLRCPQCGRGHMFSSYLGTRDTCAECGLAINGHRADDAPPYLTLMVVGHLIIPLALLHRQLFEPHLALQFAIWVPTLLLATFYFLPRSKGAMIGIQWANHLHGFGSEPGEIPEGLPR